MLDRLVDGGKTAIVIEHNLDVVARADWVIDLGPGAGHDGGTIIFEGIGPVRRLVDRAPSPPARRSWGFGRLSRVAVSSEGCSAAAAEAVRTARRRLVSCRSRQARILVRWCRRYAAPIALSARGWANRVVHQVCDRRVA